ncbi:hypothetical protein Rsub_01464 [Raphidocelis subcapitata]|uniref:SOUL heme-binding protein n=1 Tax=Raphidocelis subcapitata TaxID=307507 RepID=A0A2V0NVW7_9CHLO|nr:hypothetical protein Rsub_01464 [Raphidocelis subcapitata]|eukprot:GBF88965.1 hypothetical protein Rsub_01464 [Raphidocelis subcapitata]
MARAALAAALLLLLAAAAAAAGAAAPSARDAAAAAASTAANDRPLFCMGLDCPRFDVLETSGDEQLRRYEGARYVTTRVEAESLLAAQLEGAKRLLAYLAGANEDGAKLLPPTVPLETILFPADPGSESVEGRFCVALYLPESAQRHPPRPSDRRVRIVRTSSSDFYVLRMRPITLLDERSILHSAWRFIRRLEDEHGRCAVSRRFVSFGVYDPAVIPFVKPGYVEIGVPRSRRKCAPAGAPAAGSSDPAAAGAAAAEDGPGGEEDACTLCGECAEDGGGEGVV